MSRKINRKGTAAGKGILFFVFFFMVILIAIGLVGGIFGFFGKGYDFRQQEAEVLGKKVMECFEENNFFENKFNDNKEMFFEKCRLSKEVLEDGNHLVFVSSSDGQEFFVGVYDFKNRCYFPGSDKNKNLPLCVPPDPNVPLKIEKGGKEFNFIVGSSQNSAKI